MIDGIAFQTNILAQRSASAAREIKQLIDDSVQKVSVGSDQVARAGATMREIVDSVALEEQTHNLTQAVAIFKLPQHDIIDVATSGHYLATT